MTQTKASDELQLLASTIVNKALEEGLCASELENLIQETRIESGLTSRIPTTLNLYRKPTDNELAFKEKCYDFFKSEISIKDATSDETQSHGNLISEETYKNYLINFTLLMFASKMLVNDNEKVTNQKIRDVLWSTGEYSNYTALLRSISCASYDLRRIAHKKHEQSLWPRFNIGFHLSHTNRLVENYFEFLSTRGIY